MIKLALIGAWLMLFLNSGCAKSDEIKNSDACEVLSTKHKELLEIAKDKSCATIADCKSAGYGKRICGGVQDYLIYSANNMDENALTKKITEYNVQQEECIKASNATHGTCVIAIEPVLTCLLGVCVDTNP